MLSIKAIYFVIFFSFLLYLLRLCCLNHLSPGMYPFLSPISFIGRAEGKVFSGCCFGAAPRQ